MITILKHIIPKNNKDNFIVFGKKIIINNIKRKIMQSITKENSSHLVKITLI